MPSLTIENLNESMEAIRQAGQGQPEFLNHLNTVLEQLRETFNVDALNYCTERYINAELDFHTAGDRGLGRMSNEVPRLGGYFRKAMSKLSVQELTTLYQIIQDIMLRGYLTHALILEDPLKKSKLIDGSKLFEEWLPRVYAIDPSSTPEDIQNPLTAFSDTAVTQLTSFLEQHRMKGGGMFSEDKVPAILIYYILGGLLLRTVEVGG